ncbi:hypothetical protein [Mariniflexile ostreae]
MLLANIYSNSFDHISYFYRNFIKDIDYILCFCAFDNGDNTAFLSVGFFIGQDGVELSFG